MGNPSGQGASAVAGGERAKGVPTMARDQRQNLLRTAVLQVGDPMSDASLI